MPRFESLSEDDLQDIVQAIQCSDSSGPFFNVGGKFIHPDEIISFEGPEDSASFTLKDGTTVTHDRFAQQENGDLLYRALRVIRRPIGKSQETKPAANRYLEYDSDNRDILVYDSNGAIVNDVLDVDSSDEHSDTAQVLDQTEGAIAVVNSPITGDAGIILMDKDGNQLAQKNPADSSVARPALLQDGTQRAVFSGADSGSDAGRIELARPDGTFSTLVQNGGSASFGVSGSRTPLSIGATLDTTPGYAVVGFTFGKIGRIPLDGSTNTGTLLVDNAGSGICAVFEGEVWFTKSGEIRKHTDITNINASVKSVYDVPSFTSVEGVHHVTSDRVHVIGSSENFTINRNTGKVIQREGEKNFGFIQATLDVSLI